jgi:hypothetical protein
VNLYYGAEDMRYKQVRSTSSGTTTTHYIGKLFEVDIKGATRTYKSYISDVAIASKTNSTTTLKFSVSQNNYT